MMQKSLFYLPLMIAFAFLFAACSGLQIEKPSGGALQEFYRVSGIAKTYTASEPVVLIVASYDFIDQASQPIFLSIDNRMDRIFLDYHQGMQAVKFDNELSELLASFFMDAGMNVINLKQNKRFEQFLKTIESPTVGDMIDWTGKNTKATSVIVYYYSYGEKGEAKATGVDPDSFQYSGPSLTTRHGDIYSQSAYNISFYAFFETMVDKEIGFTFQVSTFDVEARANGIDYNHPEFVHPDTAVQSLYASDAREKAHPTLYELLGRYYQMKDIDMVNPK